MGPAILPLLFPDALAISPLNCFLFRFDDVLRRRPRLEHARDRHVRGRRGQAGAVPSLTVV